MTTRVAIYARHSTDKQTHSTQDQIARCEKFCHQSGYEIILIFQDEGISGKSIIKRPGLSDLIDATLAGYFDRVITEDLSRISRDLCDIANIFRKLRYLDIDLETVTEGEINELHIGLKGTMNELYLKDLGDKTRRGMIAAVLKGSIPGGKAYGYDTIYELDIKGDKIPGLRDINEEQANVVRWIFDQYIAGQTLTKICEGLNKQSIPSPKGGIWQPSTLIGQAARKTGLLRQTLYKGQVTFNRMMYRWAPDGSSRKSFLRPEKEWIRVPVPELTILDEGLFDNVQKMIEERSSLHKQRKLLNQVLAPSEKPANIRKRKRQALKRKVKSRKNLLYVFSGKLWCKNHDSSISVVRKRLYSCDDKECKPRTQKHDLLMAAALDAMKSMTGGQLKAAIEEQRHDRDKLEKEIEIHETKLETLRQQIRNVLDLVAQRPATQETSEYLDQKEAEVVKIKYSIDLLQKLHAPISMIPDEEADNVLQLFHNAIAPLYIDEYNQAVTSMVYPWFDRFTVNSDNDEFKITIEYNWPKLFESLRTQTSTPFLSHPTVILPRQATSQ